MEQNKKTPNLLTGKTQYTEKEILEILPANEKEVIEKIVNINKGCNASRIHPFPNTILLFLKLGIIKKEYVYLNPLDDEDTFIITEDETIEEGIPVEKSIEMGCIIHSISGAELNVQLGENIYLTYIVLKPIISERRLFLQENRIALLIDIDEFLLTKKITRQELKQIL